MCSIIEHNMVQQYRVLMILSVFLVILAILHMCNVHAHFCLQNFALVVSSSVCIVDGLHLGKSTMLRRFFFHHGEKRANTY